MILDSQTAIWVTPLAPLPWGLRLRQKPEGWSRSTIRLIFQACEGHPPIHPLCPKSSNWLRERTGRGVTILNPRRFYFHAPLPPTNATFYFLAGAAPCLQALLRGSSHMRSGSESWVRSPEASPERRILIPVICEDSTPGGHWKGRGSRTGKGWSQTGMQFQAESRSLLPPGASGG